MRLVSKGAAHTGEEKNNKDTMLGNSPLHDNLSFPSLTVHLGPMGLKRIDAQAAELRGALASGRVRDTSGKHEQRRPRTHGQRS